MSGTENHWQLMAMAEVWWTFSFFDLFQMNFMYHVNLVCCVFGGSVSAHSTKPPGAQRALRGRWLCGGTAAAAVCVALFY